jgi:phage virion morphogenesis protein
MTGVTVTLSHNSPQVLAVLRDLSAAVQDLRPAFRDAGEYLLRSTDERFRQEKGPDGAPWEQNADVTLLRYIAAKKGLSKRKTQTGGRTLTQKGAKALGSKRVLRNSGQLQDTIRYQASADALSVGTNKVYAAMQQFGGKRSRWPHLWGDIPARPFLGLSGADETEVLAIVSRHLLGAI